ncbi:MAG: hypothetical protein JW866_10330 [Ignavibacteriales bacterium]|nr:hypothetical protein [Ignavibacteriales bacterium]
MKYLFSICLIVLISCKTTQNDNRPITKNDSLSKIIDKSEPTLTEIENYIQESLQSEFSQSKMYDLTENLNADFNGDGINDNARFVKNENSGIIIVFGGFNDTTRLGFGKKFAHMTNFNWVDYWAIVNDSVTFEILFKDNEISGDTLVQLENSSIVLIEEEASSGLITFKNGEFIWIHQTD